MSNWSGNLFFSWLGMLMMATDPSFYEAHAVVLSNRGQHRQALVIYVFKMKDYAKAEEYVSRVPHPQKKSPLN